MKKITGLLVLICMAAAIPAHTQAGREKIYVQTDRQEYLAGETIYFKGFVFSATDSVESSNFFVELWDADFHKLAGISLPVIDGTVAGTISIPDAANRGPVLLRAYTEMTATDEQPDQFIKPVTGGAKPDLFPSDKSPQFFPEGGHLVYQAINHLTYQAAGLEHGIILSSNGDTVARLAPVFNGLGSCSFTALTGETYTCEYSRNGIPAKTPLPVPVMNGIAVHIRQSPDTLYFDLDNGGTRETRLLSPKIQLLINEEVVYLVTLNMSTRSRFSYFIPLKDYHTGPAELRILDANEKPVARRPLFILRHGMEQEPKAEFLKKDLGQRGENRILLHFPDSNLQYVSVSITDATYDQSSDKPGMLPAVSTISGGDYGWFRGLKTPEQLDLVIRTQTPGKIPEEQEKTTIRSSPPQYLQLYGTVKRGKKPLAEKELLVGIRSQYTGKELHKLVTDDQGHFVLDGLIIYGEAYVHCRLPGNAEEELTYSLRLNNPAPIEEKPFFESFRHLAGEKIPDAPVPVIHREKATEDTLMYNEKVITLTEVLVKSDNNLVTRKRLEDLEKKYADGTAFGGYTATGESLDVLNDPRSAKFLDLFSYIGQQMHSVSLRYVRGDKQLYYYGRGFGGETMVTVFYLGNMKVDRDILNSISLDEVALIKFIPMLGSERGFPPAIIIFLKKPGDQGYWEKDRYQLSEQTIYGYPVARDLPEPDYSQDSIKVEKDLRKTLFWRPYLPVEKGVADIHFNNNDRARKLRMIVEGLAADGSIIYWEKEIE